MSAGMICLLNEFVIHCRKKLEDAIKKIINVNERQVTAKWKWEKTLAILRNDLLIEDWKKYFVKSKCRRKKSSEFKMLGEEYLDNIQLESQNYGLATNIQFNVKYSKRHEKGTKIRRSFA